MFETIRIDVHRHDGFVQELQSQHQCGVAGSSTCIHVVEKISGPSTCLSDQIHRERELAGFGASG